MFFERESIKRRRDKIGRESWEWLNCVKLYDLGG